MLPSTSLRVRIIALLFAIALFHGHPAGQSADHSILFSSDQPDVQLRDGTALTLRTVDPGHAVTQPAIVPPGQLVQAALSRALDGRKASVGDPVELEVVYPFHFTVAEKPVRVPPKATILGHITAVARRAAKHGEAHLAVALDALKFSGEEFALDAEVVTLQVAPPRTPMAPPAGFLHGQRDHPDMHAADVYEHRLEHDQRSDAWPSNR